MAEIFSTVMRGYKKEEVTSYIADLSDQLQMLKNDLDRKDIELDRLNKELDATRGTPAEPSAERIEAIREEVKAELEAEFAAKLVAKENELAEQREKSADISDLERKAREYDECKDTLAELMIQARKNADEIVEKAQAKANMLQAKAEMEFSQLNTSFAVLQQNVANVRGEIQISLDSVSDQVSAFEQKIADLQTDIEATISASHVVTDE